MWWEVVKFMLLFGTSLVTAYLWTLIVLVVLAFRDTVPGTEIHVNVKGSLRAEYGWGVYLEPGDCELRTPVLMTRLYERRRWSRL